MADTKVQQARGAIGALRRSHDELAALAHGLDGERLRAQSGSSEWTVADVLGHLGSAAEIAVGTLTAGKADPDSIPAIWDRWNAMSPEEKAGAFVASEGRLVQALEALDDEALRDETVDVGFLPQPISIAFLTSMRLSEIGLHRWDIDVALDPAAAQVPIYTVPFILDVLPNFAPFFSKPIGTTGQVAVATTNPDRTYVLELGDQNATLTEGNASDAGTRAAMPAEAFLRLTGGRLAPEHTPASVTVTGELNLDDLRRAFPGY
jgi:uncharacterized protein (TIGR03083 family)